MSAQVGSTKGKSCGQAVENIGSLWENYTNVSGPATTAHRPGPGRTTEEFDMGILAPATPPRAIPRADDA